MSFRLTKCRTKKSRRLKLPTNDTVTVYLSTGTAIKCKQRISYNYYIVRGWGGGRGRGLNYHSRYKGSLCLSPDLDTGSRKVLTPRKVPGRRASLASVVSCGS